MMGRPFLRMCRLEFAAAIEAEAFDDLVAHKQSAAGRKAGKKPEWFCEVHDHAEGVEDGVAVFAMELLPESRIGDTQRIEGRNC